VAIDNWMRPSFDQPRRASGCHPTAPPLVYEVSADLKSIGHAYLGDPAVIAAALQAVANQGKAKIA
jgi:hypothetical protein